MIGEQAWPKALESTARARRAACKHEDALAVLKENMRRHPDDRETLSAAIALSREKQEFAAAPDYAERLARLLPEDPNLPRLIEELRRRKSAPGP